MIQGESLHSLLCLGRLLCVTVSSASPLSRRPAGAPADSTRRLFPSAVAALLRSLRSLDGTLTEGHAASRSSKATRPPTSDSRSRLRNGKDRGAFPRRWDRAWPGSVPAAGGFRMAAGTVSDPTPGPPGRGSPPRPSGPSAEPRPCRLSTPRRVRPDAVTGPGQQRACRATSHLRGELRGRVGASSSAEGPCLPPPASGPSWRLGPQLDLLPLAPRPPPPAELRARALSSRHPHRHLQGPAARCSLSSPGIPHRTPLTQPFIHVFRTE